MTPPPAAAEGDRRRASAVRLQGSIHVDGRLDETSWQAAPAQSDFWQRAPKEGEPPASRTEFKVVYDDHAIYVGLRAYDPEPASIRARLHRRDLESRADWLGVILDSYHDRRTAYGFAVNAANVQRDVFLYDDGADDSGWDDGVRSYDGVQERAYASMVYQQVLGDGNDQVKAGLSFQFDDYEESFINDAAPALDLGRTERMPGVFAEHTLKRARFTVVSGLRVDANDLYGTVASPRVHAKYDIGPLTTARASVGRGFRTANLLVENAAVMASSRGVLVDPLDMERAWNFGASLLHKFKWLERKWAIAIDAYRTQFEEQVVSDLDRDPRTIAIYMLDGPSYSNSLLADVQVEIARTLLLKTSYRYYDVRTTYHGRLLERPFTPSHRGLIDLAYADRKEHWRFDINLNLFGPSRLPSTSSNPEGDRFPEWAPAYSTLHAQLTRIAGAWEFYLGAENITSTLQQQQIIAADDPFGPYFDASLFWGPTNKAMLYGGLRFTLNRKNNQTNQP